LLVVVQLPDSASLERTDEVMLRADKIVRHTEGVAHAVRISGLSFVLGANGSHLGTMFVILDPFEERHSAARSSEPSRPSCAGGSAARSKTPC